MQVKVDKRALEDLIDRLESGGMDDILYRGMERLGNEALAVVKKNTPVSTGQLRRGWYIARLSKDRVMLKNPTSYAEYVEYGHRQNVGQFVPKLGKRLKRPWVRGIFFARRSEEIMRQNTDGILRPFITEELEKLING